MQIERTCKITLSAAEVQEALTAFIQQKHRYGSEKIRVYEECLSVGVMPRGEIMVLWGEKPKEPVAAVEEAPASVDLSVVPEGVVTH